MTEAAIYLGREFEEMTAEEKGDVCKLLAENGYTGIYLTHANKTQTEIDFDRGTHNKSVE